jgi:MFS family permease
MVGTDPVEVERALAAGELSCPGCAGVLRPWGHARWRSLRGEDEDTVRHRPRRTACSGCAATHVLLPASWLPRRADAVAVIGAAFLAGIDRFIVNVAFDEIGRDFAGAGLAELSWVLNANAVVYAALLVPMGRLADRAGQRRGFIAATALFMLASLACGFAPGIWWLVAFRVLQAVGAAAMTPASLGLLLAAVAPEQRGSAARLFAMTGAVAAALGPALGGGLVQLSW